MIQPQKGAKRWTCYHMEEPQKPDAERSQTQKATCCMSPFTWNIQSRSVHRDGKQRSGCQGLGEREWGLRFPFGVMRMLWNWIKCKMHVIVQHCGYTKCRWTVHSKMANIMLCEIYLDTHTHARTHAHTHQKVLRPFRSPIFWGPGRWVSRSYLTRE